MNMLDYRMKRHVAIGLVVLTFFGCGSSEETANTAQKTGLLSFVDTRVGTAPSIADVTVTETEEPLGYVSPIVGNPSALTHWTPQTAKWTDRVITVPVPYWYEHEKIQGFRGTRYPNGAVVGDWGPMCVMPMTGNVVIDADARASTFSHDHEVAKPHYYPVVLDDYGIKTEFTAASKTAFFQFTFPGSVSSSVLFDGVYVPGYYKVIPERNEIEGYMVIAGHFRNHFVAKFNKEF